MSESTFAAIPAPGSIGTATLVVSAENVAKKLGSGSLDVLATPALVALMEKAACEAVNPFLAPGWTTVGVKIDVSHSAPSLLGWKVEAKAEIVKAEGREIRLVIKASDEFGPVGAAEHARVAVSAEKFMERAAKRPEGKKG